jgi:sterol desaturase/sphingolipid hydroxylase (fatty acid hydroxylase superfamily)
VKGRALFSDMARAARETGLNLQIIVFNIVLVAPLIALASSALSEAAATWQLFLIPREVWIGLPLWLTLFLAVFLGDFIGYWRHRLEHTAILWPSHAVHHSDTQMTWLALERFHPVNRVTTFLIDTAFLLANGLPPAAVTVSNLLRHYYGYLIHADLPWTYGPLGRVIVSPAMHRWHHAADRAAFDTNYATVFALFDWMFGTWRVPGPCTSPLGVTDDMAPTLAGQMAYAFQPRAYRRLWARKRPEAAASGR